MATREHGLFRRLDTPAPDAAQGGCYVSHGTGPCVDTGVLIEFEGTLTLSVNTIRELAEVAGFSVDAEALQHEEDIAHLQHRVEELEAENAGLREDLNAVGRAISGSDR
jgi:hypothetical protein